MASFLAFSASASLGNALLPFTVVADTRDPPYPGLPDHLVLDPRYPRHRPEGHEDVAEAQLPRHESGLLRRRPHLAAELQRSVLTDDVVVAAQGIDRLGARHPRSVQAVGLLQIAHVVHRSN